MPLPVRASPCLDVRVDEVVEKLGGHEGVGRDDVVRVLHVGSHSAVGEQVSGGEGLDRPLREVLLQLEVGGGNAAGPVHDESKIHLSEG